jgi:selT/selW/selH-like putative selenoprotein
MGTPHPIDEVILVPASKGKYEISLDDKLIYSKIATGKHVSDADVIKLIRQAGARNVGLAD